MAEFGAFATAQRRHVHRVVIDQRELQSVRFLRDEHVAVLQVAVGHLGRLQPGHKRHPGLDQTREHLRFVQMLGHEAVERHALGPVHFQQGPGPVVHPDTFLLKRERHKRQRRMSLQMPGQRLVAFGQIRHRGMETAHGPPPRAPLQHEHGRKGPADRPGQSQHVHLGRGLLQLRIGEGRLRKLHRLAVLTGCGKRGHGVRATVLGAPLRATPPARLLVPAALPGPGTPRARPPARHSRPAGNARRSG